MCLCTYIYRCRVWGGGFRLHFSATLIRNKKTHHTNSQQRVAEEGVYVCLQTNTFGV